MSHLPRSERSPPQCQFDSHLAVSVLRRQSSRIRTPRISPPAHLVNTRTSTPLRTTSIQDSKASGLLKGLSSADPSLRSQVPPSPDLPRKRKRKPAVFLENEAEHTHKRARLTKENLRKFEQRMRSVKSGNGRKHNSSHSGAKSKSSATTTDSSKTVSTTDSSFARLAFQNGILDPGHSNPPENLASHQYELDRARHTASPSNSEYDNFAHQVRQAPNEMTMVFAVSTLLNNHERGYNRVYNHPFNDFPKREGFNDGLSAAQPDMVEGLEMTRFHPFPVRQELGGFAVPTQDRDPITLPHLAGEWKGPGKDMILAETQAAYDGACMVRGRNQALTFMDTPDTDGHAHVYTFTTDGTTLNTFAHYASESQGQTLYHQCPTSSSFLISNFDDFKKGRRRLRNLQDLAYETSKKLRDDLVESDLPNQSPIERDDSGDTHHSIPIPGFEEPDSDDNEGPTAQLLSEYYSSFSAANQEAPVGQDFAAKSLSTSFDENFVTARQDDPVTDLGNPSRAMVTPPHSSKDVPVLVGSSHRPDEPSSCDQRDGHQTRSSGPSKKTYTRKSRRKF